MKRKGSLYKTRWSRIMFSVSFICSNSGSKFQTIWGVLRLSPQGTSVAKVQEGIVGWSSAFTRKPRLVSQALNGVSNRSRAPCASCRTLSQWLFTFRDKFCGLQWTKKGNYYCGTWSLCDFPKQSCASLSWWAVGFMGWKCSSSSLGVNAGHISAMGLLCSAVSKG